ncbi:hypothetical protein ACQ4M4_06550 [Leptolyngbya sp. AN02str]|uniref:hypothetical protein n=1 Tax=Leptolyngbya sp. AN02str TaxID=3423363 RepID=UPI003D3199BE
MTRFKKGISVMRVCIDGNRKMKCLPNAVYGTLHAGPNLNGRDETNVRTRSPAVVYPVPTSYCLYRYGTYLTEGWQNDCCAQSKR